MREGRLHNDRSQAINMASVPGMDMWGTRGWGGTTTFATVDLCTMHTDGAISRNSIHETGARLAVEPLA